MRSRKKDVSHPDSSNATVRLRWLELDIDGGTSDLVEGFQSFAATLRKSGTTDPRLASIDPKPAAPTSAALDLDEPEPQEEEPTAADAAETAVGEAGLGDLSQPDDRPKRRAPKAPKFLSELDLTKASVQIGTFVGEKNPSGDMERYAVIAVWFKEYLTVGEITVDHVFTAYKALGWQAQLPPDPSQTFRNLKNNKNWFESGSTRGTYKVNWNGENAVNKMGAAKS